MTTFEELQALWRGQAETLAVHGQALDRLARARGAEALGRWARVPALELAVDAGALTLLGAFLTGPARTGLERASALLLAAGMVARVAAAAGQWALARGADPAAPLVEAQARVARLEALRIHAAVWTWRLAPLAWPFLAVVLARAGVGLSVGAGPWLLANGAFGVGVALAGPALVRLARSRWPRSAVWRRIDADLAGRSLAGVRACVHGE